MNNKQWLRYVIMNTQNSPYCAQKTIIEKVVKLEPIDLGEISKMVDEDTTISFEEFMKRGESGGEQKTNKEKVEG